MVVGVGIDLVEVDRFSAGQGPLRTSRLAARWAAKEACAKAMGTGLRSGKWSDIELLRNELGAPGLALHGHYAELAAELGVKELHLSISHTESYATAVVIAEAGGC